MHDQAVMYKVSSKGILSGIASGNAFSFLSAVKNLVSQFPEQVRSANCGRLCIFQHMLSITC